MKNREILISLSDSQELHDYVKDHLQKNTSETLRRLNLLDLTRTRETTITTLKALSELVLGRISRLIAKVELDRVSGC